MSRSGVLLASAWLEPNARDGVRIRVMWSAATMPSECSAASGIVVVEARDDLLAVITGWLARVVDTPQKPTGS